MTNRLELSWKLDGFVDEQHYYCSETPIDPLNLSAPKAILTGDVRAYTDTAIEIGKTYYIRIGSVKNGVEKLGEQISVSTNNTVYSCRYPLIKDAVDLITGKSLTLGSSSYITSDGCYFDGTVNSFAFKNDDISTTLGAHDFELSFKFKSDRSTPSAEVLIDNYTGASNSWQIMISGNGKIQFYQGGYKFEGNKYLLDGVFHDCLLSRKNGVVSCFIDDVIDGSYASSIDFSTKEIFNLGLQYNNKTYRFKGWIKDLRLSH